MAIGTKPEPKKPAAKPQAKKAGGGGKAGCKWCEKGECWTHGNMVKPSSTKGKGVGKGKMDILMQMMSQMSGAQGGAGAPSSNEPVANYKGALLSCIQKELKASLTKENTPQYTIVEIAGKQTKYQATVSFQDKTFEGPAVMGKKAAEHAAAKIAIQKAFPKQSHVAVQHASANNAAKSTGSVGIPANALVGLLQAAVNNAGGIPATVDTGAVGKGQKRKFEDFPAKNRLTHGIQLLKGEATTKEDIVFTVETVDGTQIPHAKYQASVSIPMTGNTYVGEVQLSKKAAENSAAEVALENLKDQIEPKEEERKAKIAKKNQEQLAVLKEKMAAKKAAKAAAKEAAA
jgi:hypothetical protein